MRLRNRLFLTLFVTAFLPVAIITSISLEFILSGLDRSVSPGVISAMDTADSLVTLSREALVADLSRELNELDLDEAGPTAAREFDLLVSISPADTNILMDETGRIRLDDLSGYDLQAVVSRGGGEIFVIDGRDVICVADRRDDVTLLGGREIPEGYGQLSADFSRGRFRFNQLMMLTEINKNVYRLAWGAGILIYLVAILFVSNMLARSLTRPLARIGEMAESVGRGNWNVRLDYGRNDEIGALVAGFNRMSEQLGETTARLIESEKTAAWETTARVISHGIKNVLAPVKLAIGRMKGATSSSNNELSTSLNSISSELDLLERTARDFSLFGRSPEPRMGKTDLNMLIRQSLRFVESDCASTRIGLALADNLPGINVDDNLIREALINLVKNACEAATERGVDVRSYFEDGSVCVDILNDGVTISPVIADRMFEPYFTTKSGGTGLGLAIANRSVVSCGGKLSLENGADRVVFSLSFEAADES